MGAPRACSVGRDQPARAGGRQKVNAEAPRESSHFAVAFSGPAEDCYGNAPRLVADQ
jgi:hypothetical protein